jgi:hypothetical protein
MKIYSTRVCLLSFTLLLCATGFWMFSTHTPTTAQSSGESTSPVNGPQSASLTSQPQEEQSSKTLPKSNSPYDIQFFIMENPQANLKPLWQSLGIESRYVGERNPDRTGEFMSQCIGCNVQEFKYDLDNEPGKEILLRIEDYMAQSWRYLLFKETTSSEIEGRWKFIGHIDYDFGKYREPQHMVVVSGGKTWLLVEGQEGGGIGFNLYTNRFFRVEAERLKEVLRFPSEGFQGPCCGTPVQEFTSRIMNCEENQGVMRIEIEYRTKYYSFHNWQRRQKAIYITDSARGKLMLNRAESEISQEEIEALYGNNFSRFEDILKYNFTELLKMASGKDKDAHEWLRKFLHDCDESRQMQALLRRLDR